MARCGARNTAGANEVSLKFNSVAKRRTRQRRISVKRVENKEVVIGFGHWFTPSPTRAIR
ncbi:hypothetical protein KCP77_20345 [Salmonella enterica subsp. enterica]|nr:hypothetical protein KCP77_20345 [Salmonella enterica subsp. enterica]